jgi:hypothetical protein
MEPLEKRGTLDEYNALLGGPRGVWPDTEPGPGAPGRARGGLLGALPSAHTVLTTVAHGTTPFIAVFVLVHLAAPVAAAVGGSSAASQALVRGFSSP